MSEYLPILTSLIGIIGVVAGILITEFVRRKNRHEVYAPIVFEKRLKAYEGFTELIYIADYVAREIMENDTLTKDECRDLMFEPGLNVAKYADENWLYIDEELASHCVAIFIGIDDIYEADGDEKERLMKEYQYMIVEAKRMISEDSGVAEINRLFKSINRPNLSGKIIERIRELREQKGICKQNSE